MAAAANQRLSVVTSLRTRSPDVGLFSGGQCVDPNFLQDHLGILLVSLFLAPVNGVRQMGRCENMAFESGVQNVVIQAGTLSTGLLCENNPLAGAAIREIREPRNHPGSVRRQKRSLCRLLRTDSNLQKHGHIVQITSNHGNLRHGQSSLKRVSKLTTSECTGLFLKLHLPTSPA